MDQKINFPAIVIGKSWIDRLNYRHLVSAKSFIPVAYKNVLIVDTLGNCFDTKGVRQSGGISLFYSVMLAGIMVKVEPILKQPVYQIPINDLRSLIISIVEKNPRKIAALSDAKSLIEDINNSSTYPAIIKIFGG